jgi:undecaprenyl pyrophosphate synthase
LWPDFARADLEAAIDAFRQRERRYGGLSHAESPA